MYSEVSDPFAKALNGVRPEHQEVFRKFAKELRGHRADELCERIIQMLQEPHRSWTEKNGILYFSVVSLAVDGPSWIEYLKHSRVRLGDSGKDVLRSRGFHFVKGLVTEVAVIRGSLYGDAERTVERIRADAAVRNLQQPNADVACLIRKKFTDADIRAMGLWSILTMHNPIRNAHEAPCLLVAGCTEPGNWIDALSDHGGLLNPNFGFAFAKSQVIIEP